jgi:hypothetical protein
MTDQGQSKIEVKVSASVTVPFWTAGWMYTMGALLAGPENVALLEGLPWYKVAAIIAGIYAAWPFVLGFGQWVGR